MPPSMPVPLNAVTSLFAMADGEKSALELDERALPYLSGMQAGFISRDEDSGAIIRDSLFSQSAITDEGLGLSLNTETAWPAILDFFWGLPLSYYRMDPATSGLYVLVRSAAFQNPNEEKYSDIRYAPSMVQASRWLALGNYWGDPELVLGKMHEASLQATDEIKSTRKSDKKTGTNKARKQAVTRKTSKKTRTTKRPNR